MTRIARIFRFTIKSCFEVNLVIAIHTVPGLRKPAFPSLSAIPLLFPFYLLKSDKSITHPYPQISEIFTNYLNWHIPLCVRIVVSGNNNYLWWYNIGIARKEELTAMKYSKELKDSIIRRMLPPSNDSIGKISKQEGISEQTLRNWRDNARADGIAAPGNHTFSEKWSTQDKFLIVLEAASMNETELAEYARQKGLYVEQIQAWKDACMNANGGVAQEAARLNKELKTVERENKQLEKELARKEKALAEAAALLVLRKKANAIWGEPEGE